MSDFDYTRYVTDTAFQSQYQEYQKRYASTVRESDKRIMEFVRAALDEGLPEDSVCLDIGCPTGNLLRHMRKVFPRLRLVGGDLVESIIDGCRKDPELGGIRFEIMDMLDIKPKGGFDIVIANAVLYMFGDDFLGKALRSAREALRPGGRFIVFDFAHPFRQELTISEVSRSHPEGLNLHFRSHDKLQEAFRTAGFSRCAIEPFEIPIDLPMAAPDASGFQDINSYTRTQADGKRLLFRGALFQPWCHFVAVA